MHLLLATCPLNIIGRNHVRYADTLSEIFMRAFILRRLALITRGQGNVILMGSRHSADTLRLREFLSRNASLHLRRS